LWYIFNMKKTSLLATNRYLKDRNSRDRLLRRTVLTSSAVEGAGKPAARALGLELKRTLPTPVEVSAPEQP
jgi:hypothetical protein